MRNMHKWHFQQALEASKCFYQLLPSQDGLNYGKETETGFRMPLKWEIVLSFIFAGNTHLSHKQIQKLKVAKCQPMGQIEDMQKRIIYCLSLFCAATSEHQRLIYREDKVIYHGSGGWWGQDQGVGIFCGPSCCAIVLWKVWHGWIEGSGPNSSFFKEPTPEIMVLIYSWEQRVHGLITSLVFSS
jgi:hypothetical protein